MVLGGAFGGDGRITLGFCRCGLLGVLRGLSSWCSLSLSTIGRSPKRQIVTEELHDKSAITIGLFRKRVKLRNSIVKGLLSEMTSSVRRIQNLIVKDGEIERETKANWVGWC